MIVVGLCECGCGGATRIAPRADARKGWVQGKPLRYLPGHCRNFARGPTPTKWRPLEPRFFEKVELIPFHSCWIWTGKLNAQGYGMIWYRGKEQRANRISYLIHFGVNPGSLLVCHHCDRPECVRPDHLFLGTQADNTRDMRAKGRGVNPPTRRRTCGGIPS